MRIPFALRNAPRTLQWANDVALSAIKWQPALVYIDDIVVFSRIAVDHINHDKHALSLLCNARATFKIKKSRLFMGFSDRLRRATRPRCLEIVYHMTVAMKELKASLNVPTLKSSLSLCNDFIQFVTNLGRIALPFTHKLQSHQSFNFGLNVKELEAMKSPQEKLIAPSVLALSLPMRKSLWTLMLLTFNLDAFYCRNNLIQRNSESGIGPAW